MQGQLWLSLRHSLDETLIEARYRIGRGSMPDGVSRPTLGRKSPQSHSMAPQAINPRSTALEIAPRASGC